MMKELENITYNNSRTTIKIDIGDMTVYARYFQPNDINLRSDLEWSIWDKITISFYRTKRRIKDTYWNIRYGFQRMFKGYDSVDVFETYEKFIDRYAKIITEIKHCHTGYPHGMTQEEWVNVFDKMLYHLHYMKESNVDKELCEYVPDGWIPYGDTCSEIMNRHKEEFFKLFSEYFFDLWD